MKRPSSHDAASTEQTQVLLVGYEDRDNLGLRYLLSSLHAAGFPARIVRFHTDPQTIVDAVRRERPLVVGFSLIFQYMAPDFARVIEELRRADPDVHVTMGGHYPSFDYAEVLERMPGLDTVVRFEGEATLVELLERLAGGSEWKDLAGIAYRSEDGVVANPLRAPIADLDTLPPPDRTSYDYETEALPTAAVLGSRGCPWDCSFCSIRPFYEAQGGPLRRLRKPAAVVAEMAELYETRGVSLFLFQDDDFLAGGKRAREWACEVADGVTASGLAGRLAFKISCRSDEVHEQTIAHLMRGGLTHVYMGVEAGDPQDLADMHKRLGPEKHIEAGRILRKLGLSFDFGFMLLQPYSTFDSVRNNIRFLDEFAGDGWTVSSFCRMLPYAGTPIKERLEAEQRLLGTPFEPDYRFLEPKLDLFYDWMLSAFHERNFTSSGLCHVLRAMQFEARINLSGPSVSAASRTHLHHLTSVCNRVATYTLTEALGWIERTPLEELQRDPGYLIGLARHEAEQEGRLLGELAELYESFPSRERQPRRDSGLQGGFDKTWTLAERLEPAATTSG